MRMRLVKLLREHSLCLMPITYIIIGLALSPLFRSGADQKMVVVCNLFVFC